MLFSVCSHFTGMLYKNSLIIKVADYINVQLWMAKLDPARFHIGFIKDTTSNLTGNLSLKKVGVQHSVKCYHIKTTLVIIHSASERARSKWRQNKESQTLTSEVCAVMCCVHRWQLNPHEKKLAQSKTKNNCYTKTNIMRLKWKQNYRVKATLTFNCSSDARATVMS